jgi:alpha-galactosidase
MKSRIYKSLATALPTAAALLILCGWAIQTREAKTSLYIPQDHGIILTPRPGPEPRINGPLVYGCRPGNPFIYRVPCTGTRPIRFSTEGLPESLTLDASTGIITGTTPARGAYTITLHAGNPWGNDSRTFEIIAGDQLALTPPMGWNHWYAHYNRITDAMMREAADIMVGSGMADVGYQYVNIDDCWMNAPEDGDPKRVGPLRDEKGDMMPNAHFTDMNALTDYIHAKGLKAGLYTSPGRLTCAGFAGSYDHELQDARQFARWGFDFLKYDWCSYGRIAPKNPGLEDYQAPYILMGNILQELERDIVLNLCQYGMGDVWTWGKEVGGHSWRTGGDLGFELDRIFEVALKNVAIGAYNGPAGWNDPDYIQIGWIGKARGMGEPKPCPIPPNTQYAYMSLWSLMAAPLFYSGDMSRLDDFTLNVLCNAEVIEVNQDPIGSCASMLETGDQTFVLYKTLIDGSVAVGLFNQHTEPMEVSVSWDAVGHPGTHRVRDLWRQQELGKYTNAFSALVPDRGVIMLRAYPE